MEPIIQKLPDHFAPYILYHCSANSRIPMDPPGAGLFLSPEIKYMDSHNHEWSYAYIHENFENFDDYAEKWWAVKGILFVIDKQEIPFYFGYGCGRLTTIKIRETISKEIYRYKQTINDLMNGIDLLRHRITGLRQLLKFSESTRKMLLEYEEGINEESAYLANMCSKHFCPMCGEPLYNAPGLCHKCYGNYLKEYRRVMHHNRRTKKLGLIYDLKLSQWVSILDRYDWKCRWCGGKFEVMDHVIPVREGGGTTKENVVPACNRCNLTRSNNVSHES